MARLRERLLEAVEQRTGLTVEPVGKVKLLESTAEAFRMFRDEVSELAYFTLDYFGGRPQEMQAERRKHLSQRSRVAFIHDPIAGAEAELRANFAFQAGIGPPRCNDEKVQKIVDRAWYDANNLAMFTGYAAQRRSSNSLLTQGELFDTLYVRGGKIKVMKLDADTVVDIVPDPEHRLRPLYYIGVRRTFKWNVELDRPDFDMEFAEHGQPRLTYYPHWRNLVDAEEERKGTNGAAMEPLPVIPPEKQDPGGAVVYHTAINQLDEQLRGNPPWARSIRFYSAMNEFTEARVSMAQAASQFIATRTDMGSSQSQLVSGAAAVLAQTGELGTRSFSDEGIAALGQSAAPREPHTAAPGSWWAQNERSKLESLNLKSGAGEATADAQIIRAPLAASSGFGQHYLGDASNANLATATSLELPALMVVVAWQTIFHGRYKWFVDRAIDAAVHAGELGGVMLPDDFVTDGRPLTELRLSEGEGDDKAEMESRTGTDLSYAFTMPYPGRRNLPDVTGSLAAVLDVADGMLAENESFMKIALDFLFTHGWQLDDPSAAVEDVMADLQKQLKERKELADQIAKTGGLGPGAPAPNLGGGPTPVGDAPKGATAPKTEMGATESAWLPPEMRGVTDELGASLALAFANGVELPAIIAAKAVSPSAQNGHAAGIAA